MFYDRVRKVKEELEPEVNVQVEVNIIKTGWLFKKNSDNNSDYLQIIDTLENV